MSGSDDRPTRDLNWYARAIKRGIAEADDRGSAIDHVTARRLALWLLPRSQEEPGFMRGLVYFARTGGVTPSLRDQLRHHSRSPTHPNRPHAARLLQYVTARGADLGRIGENFGAVCDQIDYADTVLEDRRQRTVESRKHHDPAVEDWQSRIRLSPVAMARCDDATRAVTFILDAQVAEAAVHAITADVMQREARIRLVREQSAELADGSYGKENRDAIVARETVIAEGLRAVERAYHAALEPTPAPEFGRIAPTFSSRTSDYEIERGLRVPAMARAAQVGPRTQTCQAHPLAQSGRPASRPQTKFERWYDGNVS